MTADEMVDTTPVDEHLLLAAILAPTLRPYLTQILESAEPDWFANPHISEIWRTARDLHSRRLPVDRRSLLAHRDSPPIRAVIAHCLAQLVRPQELPAAAHRIHHVRQREQLAQAGQRIIQLARTIEDPSEAAAAAHMALAVLDDTFDEAEATPFAVLADQWRDSLRPDSDVARRIPTPWNDLNHLISGGIEAGRFVVIAGRPGEGKSIVGLNLAQHAAENGHAALVVSQEMGGIELTGRMMASGAHASYTEITRRELSADSSRSIDEYVDSYRHMPLWVVDTPNMTIEKVAAVARTFKRRQGLDVLVVDYLQLIRPSSSEVMREQQVAHISRSCKHLSRELDCAVVAAAQLNRKGSEGAPRKPLLTDLRESGSVEQDTDGVWLLHHELGPEGDRTGFVTLIVAKNRAGRTGELELRWAAHEARVGD